MSALGQKQASTYSMIASVRAGQDPLRAEERAQSEGRFTRIVLRKKMAALYWTSGHVVGPMTPDAERSARVCIPVIERSTLAPQCERRARDAAVHLAVMDVLRKVECRCGAIFFADCMRSHAVAQRNNIGCTHFSRKAVAIRAPSCQRVSTTVSALAVIICSGKGSGCASSDQGQ